jgi:hypothetical protein
MEMGFSEAQAKASLVRHQNDLTNALNQLIENPNDIPAEQEEAEVDEFSESGEHNHPRGIFSSPSQPAVQHD